MVQRGGCREAPRDAFRQRDNGPLRPTQRFYNLQQLSFTPADAFAIPATADKQNINVAAFSNRAQGSAAVHIVNNGGACEAVINGLPDDSLQAVAYVTNATQYAEAQSVILKNGSATIQMPAESFITLIILP